MSLLVVTGADGLIGRALQAHLWRTGFEGRVRLVDRRFEGDDSPYETLTADLADPESLASAVAGADCVVHLASLPGDAAERDPAASRQINLHVALSLIERLRGKRLVYASSVAVFGSDLPNPVDDTTPAEPGTVYGTHKRMVELAFVDAVRRGQLAGAALRLPGIVARPTDGQGFGSAFLSEVFHAVRAGRRYTVPVAAEATSWLMSTRVCAQNLAHAARNWISAAAPVNLPALHVTMADLLEELGRRGDASGIDFEEDQRTRLLFGSHPPLQAERARALGFVGDETLANLVANSLGLG